MKNSLSRDCIFDIIYFSGPHIKLRVNRLFPGGKKSMTTRKSSWLGKCFSFCGNNKT